MPSNPMGNNSMTNPTYISDIDSAEDSGPSSSMSASQEEGTRIRDGKGKAPPQPLAIERRSLDDLDDLFSMSPIDTQFLFDYNDTAGAAAPISSWYADERQPGASLDGNGKGKGKGKGSETPPSLPPLSFTPGFEYSAIDWPSPSSVDTSAGPSSYGSGHEFSDPEPTSPPSGSTGDGPAVNRDSFAPYRIPTRHHSLSFLCTPVVHATERATMPLGANKRAGNLARKLLLKKRDDSHASDGTNIDTAMANVTLVANSSPGSCLTPWRANAKSRSKSTPGGHRSGLDLEECPKSHVLAVYDGFGDRPDLRGKGRSYSYPMSSLDLALNLPTDALNSFSWEVRNLFDEKLPRELKLQVFKSFVALYEEEHARRVQEGKWTALRAASSRNRFVGRERGLVELIKLGGVSRAWREVVFDGQLWEHLDLKSLPRVPPSLIMSLAGMAGSFIKTIDFTGQTRLLPDTLKDVAAALGPPTAWSGSHLCNQLTSINLSGCTGLTTNALHHLLIRSPAIERLCLRGLTAVTDTTCEILSNFCPRLMSLDVSRCSNLYADGIEILASPEGGGPLHLRELRLSGVRHITDSTMRRLAKAAPELEVLDLSYCCDLHNSALDAFVACSDEADVESVLLTSREAGRDPNDWNTRYRRRVTRLRHLSLSFCPLLTDIACANLAHAVPRLELLELAGIGSDLKDEGLVKLLETTPYIRKLDLEDAMDITDSVIEAITPSEPWQTKEDRGDAVDMPEPGHALEHLTISYALQITNECLRNLVRNCARLTVLEADSTRISASTLKEFVTLSRTRRLVDAKAVVIDCRGIGEGTVRDLTDVTRPRQGQRTWDTKKLGYLDGRDDERLDVGQDECDEARVVMKTFHSWQTVDAVRAAREKRKKATAQRRGRKESSSSSGQDYFSVATLPSVRARWWTPGGRLSRSGNASPTILDMSTDRDGCRIM